MNISLSPRTQQTVKKRLARGDYATAEQYVHALIERDRIRDSQRRMEAKLLARLDRNGAVEMDVADFRAIGQRLARAVARRKTA